MFQPPPPDLGVPTMPTPTMPTTTMPTGMDTNYLPASGIILKTEGDVDGEFSNESGTKKAPKSRQRPVANPYDIKLKRKLRKNSREKQRRYELSVKFERLCALLGRQAKAEKYAVLSEAIALIASLRQQNQELKTQKSALRAELGELTNCLQQAFPDRPVVLSPVVTPPQTSPSTTSRNLDPLQWQQQQQQQQQQQLQVQTMGGYTTQMGMSCAPMQSPVSSLANSFQTQLSSSSSSSITPLSLNAVNAINAVNAVGSGLDLHSSSGFNFSTAPPAAAHSLPIPTQWKSTTPDGFFLQEEPQQQPNNFSFQN